MPSGLSTITRAVAVRDVSLMTGKTKAIVDCARISPLSVLDVISVLRQNHLSDRPEELEMVMVGGKGSLPVQLQRVK